jgi:dihydroorotate dehydrogenase (NAD+) catalytic subunit
MGQAQVIAEPMYDPARTYRENFEQGPFGLFARTPASQETQPPQNSFLGMAVSTPFGIPAGPLVNGKFVKAALDYGFDLPIYKTVRTRRYECHPWPNVLPVQLEGDLTLYRQRLVTKPQYTDPLSITNSFGVPSYDPDFWQPDLADAAAHARLGQIVIGSFQGTVNEGGSVAEYLADFRLGARMMRETGVRVVQINLSCPNEGTGNLLCFDTPRSRAVVETVKAELGDTPLLVKLAYFRDDTALRGLIEAIGPTIDGAEAINTLSAEIVDQVGAQALPGEGRLRSGVCGRGIRWAGLEMTRRLVRLREDLGLHFAVIGTGGVSTPEDFDSYRNAGADAVMSATGAMWNPLLAQEIKTLQIKELAHER